MRMPTLETERLLIRPFTLDDLDALYQILDVELSDAELGTEGAMARDERRRWLEWSVLNYEQLAKMYQPPYGDRAVVLCSDGTLIGACGYVPCLAPFDQLSGFQSTHQESTGLSTAEFGLYYALSPAYHRRGYASEAAGALVRYAFDVLKLKRVVATTTYDNVGSMGVMRRLGMRIERNPFPEPPWLQVVGVLER
ncbi:MAG TPA: GNAT family N-acetyltransferase [Herpetosiphonaceae bacterium]